MKRLPLLASLVLFAAALLLVSVAASIRARAQGGGLGPGTQVTVTEIEDLRFVGGFVPTGSESPVVLCTFNENAPGYGAVRLSGLTVLCRQRTADFGEGAVPGVAILAILPATFRPDPQEGLALTLSVFHQDALFYGDVQSCQGQCF
jgi:hypothetical protein